MKNTENHWERIARTGWKTVYLSEIYWLAVENLELCEEVFTSAVTPPPGESYLRVDHGIHRKIYRILNNAARLSALMKDRDRRAGQSAGQYEIQSRRVRWIRSVLDGIAIAEIGHAKVRHSLEHFDEYIDETALKSSRGQIPLPSFFPIDFVLGRADTLNAIAFGKLEGFKTYPLRVYLAEERTFINCGKEIRLDKLSEECAAIAARLLDVAPVLRQDEEETSEQRGSSVLVLGPQHFEEGFGRTPKGSLLA
ncbi:hypothetical protein ACFRJ9_05310 [Paenarthrobacter sp. NPDC056912]|uniref:hypothetical protein n=1 Tax=Paenarthrobacter sp. NPDC056912 TaxID=3345965 RepID=UPI00366D52C6